MNLLDYALTHAKKLIDDTRKSYLSGLKCKYCGEIFVDDENTVSRYDVHQNVHHKDEMDIEEKMFEGFREKMVKQKKEYEKSKEEMGDSDLIFNAKERRINCDN